MSIYWKIKCKVAMFRFRHLQGIKIGNGTTINPAATFMDYGMVEIGANCSVSGALFVTHSGGDRIYGLSSTSRPIRVGNNCMIGARATIMPGVTIGDNSVIGACCYVSKNVPEGSVMKPPEAVCTSSTTEYIKRKHELALQRNIGEMRI